MRFKIYRRFLEYSYKEFSNIPRSRRYKNDNNEYWKYARAGFLLGIQESFGVDGILAAHPSSYSDVDFVKVIFENLKDTEGNLVEKLTYFLCGYDKFKICQQDAKISESKIPLANFFNNSMLNLNNSNSGTSISIEDLNKKRVFVRNVIENQ